jgi:hypothetical protein
MAAQEAGVIEKKKPPQPVRGTEAWDDAMVKARGQAERYVRALPANEPNPPFLLVVDVGHSFEVFADFTQAGKAYLPFPDLRTFRIRLEHLADEKVRERLKLIWTHPAALDPALQSADVTREISDHLAELAKSLEEAGHRPRVVAAFLTRCLFCMFTEDVGLLKEAANQNWSHVAEDAVRASQSREHGFGRGEGTGDSSGDGQAIRAGQGGGRRGNPGDALRDGQSAARQSGRDLLAVMKL